MVLNFLIILSENFLLNPPFLLEIIPTKIALLTKNPYKLANKPHKINITVES